MAKARLYALDVTAVKNGVARSYILNLKGQAKIVFDALVENTKPRLASEIDDITSKKFVTRQDTLRVTLYYLIIFKGKKIVCAFENVEKEPENAFAGMIVEK
jgi:hypothetical protein